MTIKLFIMMYTLCGFAVGLSVGILLTMLVVERQTMKNPEEAVHSFCPTQVRKVLDSLHIKNKGSQTELDDYRNNWLNWTSRFTGVDKFSRLGSM